MKRQFVQAWLASLRQSQSETQEELRPLFGRALLPSAPQRSAGATAGRGA
jgi:hypothetical protein